ncbi:MAG: hypothetical protein LBH01_06045 [Verrucomicrobiales bacterium]|nr:hypothetical protein [Verrucomicrobiales bacterium]
MRKMICFCLFLLPVILQGGELSSGVSPNHKYSVEFKTVGGEFYYALVTIANGEVLWQGKGTYQREKGAEEWALKQTANAEAHWREDSGAVAIDEANHRQMGTVLLVKINDDKGKLVPLDCKKIMAATKEPWERGRLFFICWEKGRKAKVALTGRLYHGSDNRFENRCYELLVNVDANGELEYSKSDIFP